MSANTIDGMIQIIDEIKDESENNVPPTNENMFDSLGCQTGSKSSLSKFTMNELPYTSFSKEDTFLPNKLQYNQ